MFYPHEWKFRRFQTHFSSTSHVLLPAPPTQAWASWGNLRERLQSWNHRSTWHTKDLRRYNRSDAIAGGWSCFANLTVKKMCGPLIIFAYLCYPLLIIMDAQVSLLRVIEQDKRHTEIHVKDRLRKGDLCQKLASNSMWGFSESRFVPKTSRGPLNLCQNQLVIYQKSWTWVHVDLYKYLSVQYRTPSSKSHRTFNVCFAKEEATGATALPALSGGPKFVAIGVLCQLPNEDITSTY